LTNVLGALLALLLVSILFRRSDDNDDAREGFALATTAHVIDAHGDDAAHDLADLWQLDAERDQNE
jgi:hypothetical protein